MLAILAPGRVLSLPQPRKRTTHLSRGPITRLVQITGNRRVRICVLGTSLGACPTLPFVTRRKRYGRCEAASPKADPRFTVLEGGLSTTKMVGDQFTAVERSMSNRLLGFHGVEQVPYRISGKADRVVIGYFHVLPPYILRGHILMKGNEFTIRNKNHCIQLIS